jgi:hypothetical protein
MDVFPIPSTPVQTTRLGRLLPVVTIAGAGDPVGRGLVAVDICGPFFFKTVEPVFKPDM